MLLGMGIVFAFLTLLVLLMYLSQWIFGRYSAAPPADPPSDGELNGNLVAAITAAVHRYRADQ